MRKARVAILSLMLVAFLLFVGFFAVANTPISRINEGIVQGKTTYSISSIVKGYRYESYLLMNRIALKRTLENLPYIEKVDVSFNNNKLIATCPFKEKGLAIKSKDEALFFDGESLKRIDIRDINGLGNGFLILDVDNDYLAYMEKYGFSSDFVSVIDSLMELENAKTLITRAEFSNNNEISGGFLKLVLGGIGTELIVEDLTKLPYLEECIEVIYSEVHSQRYDTIFSSRLYRLKSNGLFRIKR